MTHRDVVVWGGGCGGVAAALQSARSGADTKLFTHGVLLQSARFKNTGNKNHRLQFCSCNQLSNSVATNHDGFPAILIDQQNFGGVFCINFKCTMVRYSKRANTRRQNNSLSRNYTRLIENNFSHTAKFAHSVISNRRHSTLEVRAQMGNSISGLPG